VRPLVKTVGQDRWSRPLLSTNGNRYVHKLVHVQEPFFARCGPFVVCAQPRDVDSLSVGTIDEALSASILLDEVPLREAFAEYFGVVIPEVLVLCPGDKTIPRVHVPHLWRDRVEVDVENLSALDPGKESREQVRRPPRQSRTHKVKKPRASPSDMPSGLRIMKYVFAFFTSFST